MSQLRANTIVNVNNDGSPTFPFGITGITSSTTAAYADVAGIATVAEGLTGTPDIAVGVVTATAFVGDGSGLTGVGGGLGRPVNDTFNTVGLVTTFNATVNLNDASAGVGSHFVTVTSPILELGPSGDVTVGADKILVVDPVQLAPWS